MQKPHSRSLLKALAAAACGLALLAGCGGGGDDSTTSTGAVPTASTPPPRAQGAPKLSASLCRGLEPRVAAAIAAASTEASTPLRVRSSGTAALSTCAYSSPAATVSISLDTAAESHQRFSNRIVEAIQFSNGVAAQTPRNVPGVGDPGANYGGAVWIASRAQLLAIRGNRLVIVGFYVDGAPDRLLTAGAADLTRRTYVITPSSMP